MDQSRLFINVVFDYVNHFMFIAGRSRFCLAPRSDAMSRRACCCTKGRAWGLAASAGEGEEAACAACPAHATPEFQKLCPLGLGRGGSGEDLNECEMMADLCQVSLRAGDG
jgi:hypothetical protein